MARQPQDEPMRSVHPPVPNHANALGPCYQAAALRLVARSRPSRRQGEQEGDVERTRRREVGLDGLGGPMGEIAHRFPVANGVLQREADGETMDPMVWGQACHRLLQSLRHGTGIRQSAEVRSEEHTSELQSRFDLVCRLLLEKKKKNTKLKTR